jgi:hypothetical protein
LPPTALTDVISQTRSTAFENDVPFAAQAGIAASPVIAPQAAFVNNFFRVG